MSIPYWVIPALALSPSLLRPSPLSIRPSPLPSPVSIRPRPLMMGIPHWAFPVGGARPGTRDGCDPGRVGPGP